MPKKLFVFLFLLVLLPVVIYFSLAAKYKYNVAQDYQYALNGSLHTEIKTQLKQGEFSFSSPTKWDTGFIRVRVKSTVTGYFAEPFIEILSGEDVSVLTLERGVDGERYINLPSVSAHTPVKIQLVAHHLSIEDQQASLVLFSNPRVQQQPKILIISPHPDDAEIAAFGLYSQHNTLIVTVTAGEAGPHRYDDIYPDVQHQHQIKGKLRVWDSITVPMLGGVLPERAINLGYFDNTLPQMYAQPNSPVHSRHSGSSDVNDFRLQNLSKLTPLTNGAASWTALVNDLKQIIQNFNPDIIVTPYPVLDWHLDHKFSTYAVLDALQQLNLQQGQLFLYTNHLSFNNYFPYGAQGELAPIPPDFTQSLYFDSLYSFILVDPKAKIFALDAMHDLRPDTTWLKPSGAFKLWAKAVSNKFLLRDQSYFRRAVRANELFFVVNFSSLYEEKVIRSLKGAEE